jgi:hypothetical protein
MKLPWVAGGSTPKNKELKKDTLKKTNIECCYPLLPLIPWLAQGGIDLAAVAIAGRSMEVLPWTAINRGEPPEPSHS